MEVERVKNQLIGTKDDFVDEGLVDLLNGTVVFLVAVCLCLPCLLCL